MTEPTRSGLRRLVPTERQRDVGDEGDYRGRAADAAPADGTRTPRRGLLRTLVHDLDPRSLEGPKLVLLILCLISLFARIDDAALGVLLPQIRAEFGISLTFLGGLSAVVGILYTFMAIPMGYLADRVRRVWMLRIGTLSTAATVICSKSAHSAACQPSTSRSTSTARCLAGNS